MATSLTIDGALKDRIQALADQRHRSVHRIMLDAIEQYVEREEAHDRFTHAGVRAWEAYQSNGLHLTLEEADAWLEKLEAGEDAELPPCHT